MAKAGFDATTVPAILADLSNKEGWVLCVGAGVSRPLFPTWAELVDRLVGRDPAFSGHVGLAADLLLTYSPDAVIQAAQDRLHLTDDEFRRLLVTELYADVAAYLTPNEFAVFCDVLAMDRPAFGVVRNWMTFLQIVRTRYPSCSSLAIANVLSEIARSSRAPRAVLSFNAEPLLLALTNALQVERFKARGDPHPRVGDRKMVFDYVTHSVSRRNMDRIPYIFCHGLLPVPDPAKRNYGHSSPDKLVFSEAEYLQLANTSFAWQSSAFLAAASTEHIVFVGVSLSDANMRRWLAWAYQARLSELGKLYGSPPASTSHYWVAKYPANDGLARWTESALAHLGVRPVWMAAWSDLEETLGRLLAM